MGDQQIPYKLLNKYKLMNAIFQRSKLSFDEHKQELSVPLKDLVRKVMLAKRAYEDCNDRIGLKKIDDPKYQLSHDELVEVRRLQRELEDANYELASKENELDSAFTKSEVFKPYFKNKHDLEEWVVNVSIFLECRPNDINWEKGTYVKQEECSVPDDLL